MPNWPGFQRNHAIRAHSGDARSHDRDDTVGAIRRYFATIAQRDLELTIDGLLA